MLKQSFNDGDDDDDDEVDGGNDAGDVYGITSILNLSAHLVRLF